MQAERAGISVINGGYRVYTTLDPALGVRLSRLIIDGTNRIEQQKGYKHLTQAAAKNNESELSAGDGRRRRSVHMATWRALVGGRNYARAPFNRAVSAKRQPGSSIKPDCLRQGAIEDSVAANTIIPDTALTIPTSPGVDEPYKPRRRSTESSGGGDDARGEARRRDDAA